MTWNPLPPIIDIKALLAQLNRIEAKLDALIKQETQMAIDLTKITAEVANNTTVEGSVLALLTQLAAIIAAIPASTDPVTQAALDQLTSTLAANDTALAAAVAANTPAPAGGAAPAAKTRV